MKTTVAYISHSAQSKVKNLRKLLEREGLTTRDSFDISAPADISKAVESHIRGADFVIAVIGQESSNVFFEVGFASALRKPLLLLLEPGTPAPAFAAHEKYLVSDLTDSQILRLAIKRFLEEVESRSLQRRRPRRAHSVEQPDRVALRGLLGRVRQLRTGPDAWKVEGLAAELLRAAGVTAVEEYRGGEQHGVDLAVWSDALHPSLGNPLLVGIKAGRLSEATFRETYRRLVSQVSKSGARAGLLLYLDSSDRRFRKPDTWAPFVLAFDLEDFTKELLAKPFARVLVERRNKLVHGLSE